MLLIRSFIAVELPQELKKELAELEAKLKKNCPPVVKWVDPKSIHITLKFLGAISEDRINKLMLTIEKAAQSIPPFRLEVRDTGAFPNLEHVQVIWVGVKGELEIIAQLQKRIEINTEQLGFPRESRPFSPHLTLGRVRDNAGLNDRLRIGKLLADTHFIALHNVDVKTLNLIKSQLTAAGPIYTRIGSVQLK
jgi:2'-5' RNA ligase